MQPLRRNAASVHENLVDGIVYRRVPSVSQELSTRIARVVVLPPGSIDASLCLDKVTIDVNIHPTYARLMSGSGNEQVSWIPGGSFALYPPGTLGSIKFVNRTDRCVIEIEDEIAVRYFGLRSAFFWGQMAEIRYVVDDIAAYAGLSVIDYLKKARTDNSAVTEKTVDGFSLNIVARAAAKLCAA